MRCDESDPEFIRVTQHFIDQNFNFKSLVVELFSSPLVTHLSEPESLVGSDPIISITRREHLGTDIQLLVGKAVYDWQIPSE